MIQRYPTITEIAWLFAALAAGFCIGQVVQIGLFRIIARWSRGKTWEGLLSDLRILRSVVVLWAMLIGLCVGINSIPVPLQLSALLHRLIIIVIILSVAFAVAQVAVALIRLYARRAEGAGRATSILINLTRLTIFLVGILIVLDSLGISIMPAVTALGVAGLAVALALQSTLANLFAGLQILASKQIKPGDYVRLGSSEEGYVADITWRTTALRTPQNNIVFIPNSALASATITNYSFPDKSVEVAVQVALNRSADPFQAEKTLQEVAREVLGASPFGVAEFEPRIRWASISESSLTLTVSLRVSDYGTLHAIRDQFIRRLTMRFEKEGVLKSVA